MEFKDIVIENPRSNSKSLEITGLDHLISDKKVRDYVGKRSSNKAMHLVGNCMMRLPGGFLYDAQGLKNKVDEAITQTGINPERIKELNLRRKDKQWTSEYESAEEDLFEVTYPVYCVLRSKGCERITLI